MTTMDGPDRIPARRLIRASWERVSVYLPLILMAFLAMGTYWLARNTPMLMQRTEQAPPTHEPDSTMRNFSVKTFDADGRLKSQVNGTLARHYPDTDTLEIENPRIHSYGQDGALTVATARLGISNADGSEVQLIGEAVVTRDAQAQAGGPPAPRIQFRGEFLDAFPNAERVRSHKPVELTRGADRFTADAMEYDNLTRVLELKGNVHGTMAPHGAVSP